MLELLVDVLEVDVELVHVEDAFRMPRQPPVGFFFFDSSASVDLVCRRSQVTVRRTKAK